MVGEARGATAHPWFCRVSVSLPRLGGWRVHCTTVAEVKARVSVSLPRLGGWRVWPTCSTSVISRTFQSRCRDWVVGEQRSLALPRMPCHRFSLVAEIGWLARCSRGWGESRHRQFQSRCRDWVVGESTNGRQLDSVHFKFQSRCRDWVVGETKGSSTLSPSKQGFSLVAEIGWLARRHQALLLY